MDNSDEGFKHNWLVYFLVGMLVWTLFLKEDKYEDRTAEEWFNEYDYQFALSTRLRDALEKANNNIEEANSMIESAKGYSWESYEDMGDALDSLDTVDTISEP